MLFTIEQAGKVKQGKLSGTLVPISEPVRAGSIRVLRQRAAFRPNTGRPPHRHGTAVEVLAWIDMHLDGQPRVTVVTARATPNDDPMPVLLTVRTVRRVVVDELTAQDARLCGYLLGATALRDVWTAEHPRQPLATLVTFTVGDVRDVPRFLTSTRKMRWAPGKHGGQPLGDYTSAQDAFNAGEVMSPSEYRLMAAQNSQRHAAHKAKAAAELAARTPAQRLEASRRVAEEMRLDLRSELRMIERPW